MGGLYGCRTNSECNAGRSRSRALRIFPETDHRFGAIFGLREDSESANSDHKNRPWNRRGRTLRYESVEFNNIGYQLLDCRRVWNEFRAILERSSGAGVRKLRSEGVPTFTSTTSLQG